MAGGLEQKFRSEVAKRSFSVSPSRMALQMPCSFHGVTSYRGISENTASFKIWTVLECAPKLIDLPGQLWNNKKMHNHVSGNRWASSVPLYQRHTQHGTGVLEKCLRSSSRFMWKDSFLRIDRIYCVKWTKRFLQVCGWLEKRLLAKRHRVARSKPMAAQIGHKCDARDKSDLHATQTRLLELSSDSHVLGEDSHSIPNSCS